MVSGTEPNSENKLFVGGCPPGSSEEELRQIFEKHGTVEEVFIMRGGSRSGMACAFIRFETQAMAQAAIDSIHGHITLPSTAEPLVVRWADAPGSRRRETRGERRPRGGGNGGGNGRDNLQGYPPFMGGMGGMGMHPQLAGQLLQQQMAQMHPQMGGGFGGNLFPQQQMAQMQPWHQHQIAAQMLAFGYPPSAPPLLQQPPMPHPMMMPHMHDPRMGQGFGRPEDGFAKEGLDMAHQGVVAGPAQHWPYS